MRAPAATTDGPSGRLDRLIELLYRRTGPRYMETLLAIQVAWILLFIAPTYSTIGHAFYDFERDEWLALVGLCDLAILVATPGLFALVQRRHAAVIRWLRGATDADAAAALAAAIVPLPGTIVLACGWFFAWIVPPTVYVASLIGGGTSLRIGWPVVQLAFIACAGLFAYLMFERALRPVVRDLAAELPVDTDLPSGGASLRAKLLAVLLLLSMFSACAVAAATANTTDGLSVSEQTWVVIGASLLFTFTVGLALSLLVRESLLTRLETLRRAMGRVDRGEYDAHVPPTGGDELDEVGRSFNQMVARLRVHDEELRESRARIVAASDEARRQVERDLHDGAQQQLVTLRLRLGMARQAMATDPERAAALLDEAGNDLSSALEELRDLAHGIYPAVLTTDGLPAALDVAAERCPLPVTIECLGAEARSAPDVEAAVYFCCVEALQNAAKHAGPDATVEITIDGDPDALRFEVRDDGVGYDPAALGLSAGLQNMADRIGALGGTLRVESAIGAGTRVVGTMPEVEPRHA